MFLLIIILKFIVTLLKLGIKLCIFLFDKEVDIDIICSILPVLKLSNILNYR